MVVYLERAKQTSQYAKNCRGKNGRDLEETLAETAKCGIPYGHRTLLLLVK